MTDAIQLFYEIATQSGTALYGLVGTRVWCPVAANNLNPSQAFIVFHQDGGSITATDKRITASITAKCYGGGKTYSSARTVAQALISLINRYAGTLTAGTPRRVGITNVYQGPAEPDGWPSQVVEITIETY